MRVRYTGPLEAVDLALPGAVIQFTRLDWRDLDEAVAEAGIAPEHADIAVRALKDAPEWEVEAKSKSSKADEKDGNR